MNERVTGETERSGAAANFQVVSKVNANYDLLLKVHRGWRFG